MPNFVVIGAAKAGTTSLDRYLRQHPEIFICPINEPKFFCFEGEKLNYNYPKNVQWKYEKIPINNNAITDLESYQSLFSGVTTEKAIGEVSPIYLYLSEKTSMRIKEHIPNTKIIAILRNPVERAYANFTHLIRDELEPLTDFKDAINAEEERIKDNWWPFWHYKEHGFYYKQLCSYFEHFDHNQIKVYLYEDYVSNPSSLFNDLFHFLEVDDQVQIDTSSRYNVSGIPRSRSLYKVLETRNALTKSIRSLVPPKIRQQIRSFVLSKPPISTGTKQELIELYRSDILKLQDLIKRDLTEWLSC
ncbi:sulfotransferase [Acaryochloris sp. IP29b_bin.137]|uniref:sulfotransferase family protein n=1 Tax=Acaryochloris sp. IP29b_bin.137 TaxID=2969217 RepID=UPI00260288F6|nr:sulfotransferase [Acaryochloris sp. IP29b_bin.137]